MDITQMSNDLSRNIVGSYSNSGENEVCGLKKGRIYNVVIIFMFFFFFFFVQVAYVQNGVISGNSDLLTDFPEGTFKEVLLVSDIDSVDKWLCYNDSSVKCRTVTFAMVCVFVCLFVCLYI
jgi:hypothetical protein